MFRSTLIASAAALLLAPSASAQNAVLTEFYGQGVHAFYAGDYLKASDLLSKAIDGGIRDPRAFYFRGLTAAASGRQYEAEADYRAGAELEAQGAFASVGPSLTRIQGTCRMEIEAARQQARLDFAASAAGRSRARYGDIQAAEDDVLRDRPTAPPARRPVPPATPPAVDNPFAEGPAAGQPQVEANDALEGTMTDPFADDPAAPAGNAPAAADPSDPFGGSAAPAAEADPFGGAAPAAPAAPATDADPFGAGSDPFQ